MLNTTQNSSFRNNDFLWDFNESCHYFERFLAMLTVWMDGTFTRLLGRPLSFRLKKCRNNYWADTHEIWYRQSWSAEDEL